MTGSNGWVTRCLGDNGISRIEVNHTCSLKLCIVVQLNSQTTKLVLSSKLRGVRLVQLKGSLVQALSSASYSRESIVLDSELGQTRMSWTSA